MDFVLWKPSGEGLPGWESPWGRGPPGLAYRVLGDGARTSSAGPFDIHGGGLDLQFPHHENELAQSRCAHPDEAFARVWVHNEMLTVDGRKMSKSLGNFTTVRDLLDRGVPGEVIRMVLLGAQYGKPLDWTEERLTEARDRMGVWHHHEGMALSDPAAPLRTDVPPDGEVIAALANDLNVPGALARLYRLANRAHAVREVDDPAYFQFRASLEVFGVALDDVDRLERRRDIEMAAVQVQVDARARAKAMRDFVRADAIRANLAAAWGRGEGYPRGCRMESRSRLRPGQAGDDRVTALAVRAPSSGRGLDPSDETVGPPGRFGPRGHRTPVRSSRLGGRGSARCRSLAEGRIEPRAPEVCALGRALGVGCP